MPNHTKIVCTIGPAIDSSKAIEELIGSGMNAARLNFSHGSYLEHQERIDRLKSSRAKLCVPLAIIIDTKGPEVRLGKISSEINIKPGDTFELTEQAAYDLSPVQKLPITPTHILEQITEQTDVLIDDGYLLGKIRRQGSTFEIYFKTAGVLKACKSINFPSLRLDLPAITEKDKEDLIFAIKNEVDWIAASFIRNASQVLEIKRFLETNGGSSIRVAAKIENQEGVDHFDEILAVSDGIMVARGDLGVQVPLSQVPRLQKMIIRKTVLAGKPVITATQMLESMISNPRPTRAEVSDVANAVYDSSSALMLSGETAVGKYPIETVKTMCHIVKEAEGDFDYLKFFKSSSDSTFDEVTSNIAMATVKTAFSSKAKAIFCFTHGGRTAQLISRHRPEMKILAITNDLRVYHQLALNWGIEPILMDRIHSITEAFSRVSELALSKGWVKEGDLVLMTAGSPLGVEGSTNLMLLDYVGDVILRGFKGLGLPVSGKLKFIDSCSSAQTINRNHILFLKNFHSSFEETIAKSAAVVYETKHEGAGPLEELCRCCLRLGVSLLVCREGASEGLQEDLALRIDPVRALGFRAHSCLRS